MIIYIPFKNSTSIHTHKLNSATTVKLYNFRETFQDIDNLSLSKGFPFCLFAICKQAKCGIMTSFFRRSIKNK